MGTECLTRLNGMFAFAIWDREERTLFAARDRLGVKPLVYTWDGREFAFASETKALHAGGFAPGGVDPNAVYEYLARGYTSEGRSFHEGVHVLEPDTRSCSATACRCVYGNGGTLTAARMRPSATARPGRTTWVRCSTMQYACGFVPTYRRRAPVGRARLERHRRCCRPSPLR